MVVAAKGDCVQLHLDVGRVTHFAFLLIVRVLVLPLVLEKYERKCERIEFVEFAGSL